MEPRWEVKPIPVERDGTQTIMVAKDLGGIVERALTLFKEAQSVVQKKRRLGDEKWKRVEVEVNKLKEARFVKEVMYTMWLANVVMVKKPSRQWWMCTDYMDLKYVLSKLSCGCSNGPSGSKNPMKTWFGQADGRLGSGNFRVSSSFRAEGLNQGITLGWIRC